MVNDSRTVDTFIIHSISCTKTHISDSEAVQLQLRLLNSMPSYSMHLVGFGFGCDDHLPNHLERGVAKSHCFTVRLKILGVVSQQTLRISLQNWVKGSLIFNNIYYS